MPELFWGALVSKAVRPQLDVLVCGAPSQSPADLLSLARMRELIAEASGDYDSYVGDRFAGPAGASGRRAVAGVAGRPRPVDRPARHDATRVGLDGAVAAGPCEWCGLVHLDSRDIPSHYRDSLRLRRCDAAVTGARRPASGGLGLRRT